MKYSLLLVFAFVCSALITSCVAIVLAPGAAQVRIVRTATDVSACTAVGNVVPTLPDTPNSVGNGDARNITVGLGGNTLFVTQEFGGRVIKGIAYRCP